MQLIYYSHSYREDDALVVEFFGELMRSEGMVPSLDPPSDRLNSAKPERHLSSTDGMVAVLTDREGGVSKYMLYEISLCLRTQKPLLVFVEDVLPDGLIPPRILQRRFSRRGLLRELRNHRHAIHVMKAYLGDNPPPQYQPPVERRSCLLVGHDFLPEPARRLMLELVEERQYTPVPIDPGDISRIYDSDRQELISSADLAICIVNAPDADNHFVLGAARAFLTPAILLTTDREHQFFPNVPIEYQPRIIDPRWTKRLRETLDEEMNIFEEEYLDLEDQDSVTHYSKLLIQESASGVYSADLRKTFMRELVQIGEYNVSQDHIHIEGVTGNVNVKSSLDNVTQRVRFSSALSPGQKRELEGLLHDLRQGLQALEAERPEDAESVVKSAELVIAEATKERPNRSFLKVTAKGLEEAAKAVEAIAPSVLKVAARIASLVIGL